jgi:hypothetical protein
MDDGERGEEWTMERNWREGEREGERKSQGPKEKGKSFRH